MFTSRAEFRLTLRADNADERLTGRAIDLGIASSERERRYGESRRQLDEARALAGSLAVTPNEAARFGLSLNRDGVRRTAYDLLAYPDMDLTRLSLIWPKLGQIAPSVGERLETEARYAVYLDRQSADAAVLRREQARAIPADVDFAAVPGLSNELKQKLRLRKPRSIAEAQRIDGMTPAGLALILASLQNRSAEAARGVA